MKVTIVARTVFDGPPSSVPWQAEDNGAQDLAEFAGRACYQSWNRPNPATATNEGYLKHIIEVGHGSVMHHGQVTFYIEDVSRSLTHELVRHHHLDPSQLSQRFTLLKTGKGRKFGEGYVVPPLFREDGIAATILEEAWVNATVAYEALVERGLELIEDIPEDFRPAGTDAKKAAREAARCVLPNMTPTAVVMSGNHRAWREAIQKRASVHADAEISELFIEIWRQLSRLEPNLYQDMHLMNNGHRPWICSCHPGGSFSRVSHAKFEVEGLADPETWK